MKVCITRPNPERMTVGGERYVFRFRGSPTMQTWRVELVSWHRIVQGTSSPRLGFAPGDFWVWTPGQPKPPFAIPPGVLESARLDLEEAFRKRLTYALADLVRRPVEKDAP